MCDIKHEDNLLPITEIKIEHHEIKIEVKTEAYDINMKKYDVDSMNNVSEVQGLQEYSDNFLEDYKKKSEYGNKNEGHEANLYDNFEEDLQRLKECTEENTLCDTTHQIIYHNNTKSADNNSTCTELESAACVKEEQRTYLSQHLSTHKFQKEFCCEHCSRSFARKSSLNDHMRGHESDKPFVCNICKKSFSKKSTLLPHIRIHTSEKPFLCNLCTKSFTQRSSLNRHVRTHTNEKTFTCNFCSKSFHRKSTLARHIDNHTKLST
ncbi:hypothetical protein L9F63_022358 [Diploptera punctata]|uniref:C2H2-type domain-containing protein n=1 Tax=Diploptera punctata TaxID=6984 RepID=A0AAD8EB20_DIPPU|nr:hypothetical protein L9F63_022358 [Diploptera punctata]